MMMIAINHKLSANLLIYKGKKSCLSSSKRGKDSPCTPTDNLGDTNENPEPLLMPRRLMFFYIHVYMYKGCKFWLLLCSFILIPNYKYFHTKSSKVIFKTWKQSEHVGQWSFLSVSHLIYMYVNLTWVWYVKSLHLTTQEIVRIRWGLMSNVTRSCSTILYIAFVDNIERACNCFSGDLIVHGKRGRRWLCLSTVKCVHSSFSWKGKLQSAETTHVCKLYQNSIWEKLYYT